MTRSQRKGALLRIADECVKSGELFPAAAVVAPLLGVTRATVGRYVRSMARAGELRIEPFIAGRPRPNGGVQMIRRIKVVERVA